MAGSFPRLPQRLIVSGETRRISATSRIVKRSGKSVSDTLLLLLFDIDMVGIIKYVVIVVKRNVMRYTKPMFMGPFYFESKELFLALAAVLLFVARFVGWEPVWFDADKLLTLLLLILIVKGLVPTIHNQVFFIVSIVALMLTLYFSLIQVLLFYVLTFAFLKIFKVI